MEVLEKGAADCSGEEKCLDDLYFTVQHDFQQLSQIIRTATDDSIMALSKLKTSESNCATNAMNYLQTDGKVIYDRIVACISSKK